MSLAEVGVLGGRLFIVFSFQSVAGSQNLINVRGRLIFTHRAATMALGFGAVMDVLVVVIGTFTVPILVGQAGSGRHRPKILTRSQPARRVNLIGHWMIRMKQSVMSQQAQSK